MLIGASPVRRPACIIRVPFVLGAFSATSQFKIAVIVQQIYVRGHTRDARFAHLNNLVAVLGEQADQSIATERV
jgi:hypothetical protein